MREQTRNYSADEELLLFTRQEEGFLVVRLRESILEHHRIAYHGRDADETHQQRPEKQVQALHSGPLTAKVHCIRPNDMRIMCRNKQQAASQARCRCKESLSDGLRDELTDANVLLK